MACVFIFERATLAVRVLKQIGDRGATMTSQPSCESLDVELTVLIGLDRNWLQFNRTGYAAMLALKEDV